MTNRDERLYRFHWRSGEPSEGRGRDVADAFGRLGYGGGAIAALDYYEIVSEGTDDCARLKPEYWTWNS